jgi:hypothetical protein
MMLQTITPTPAPRVTRRKPRRDPCATIRALLADLPEMWKGANSGIGATAAEERRQERAERAGAKLYRMVARLAGLRRAHTMGELQVLALALWRLTPDNVLLESEIPSALARSLGVDVEAVEGGCV